MCPCIWHHSRTTQQTISDRVQRRAFAQNHKEYVSIIQCSSHLISILRLGSTTASRRSFCFKRHHTDGSCQNTRPKVYFEVGFRILLFIPKLIFCSSRTNFMIETLTNLKNNKLKKAVAGGAGGTGGPEAVERLKKFLSGMNKKRHGAFLRG